MSRPSCAIEHAVRTIISTKYTLISFPHIFRENGGMNKTHTARDDTTYFSQPPKLPPAGQCEANQSLFLHKQSSVDKIHTPVCLDSGLMPHSPQSQGWRK